MILFVNACVRPDSRTKRLADCLLRRFSGAVKAVKLDKTQLPEVNADFIAWRNERSGMGDFASPVFDLAKDFAAADTVVIAAPYWDLSFPAALKRYIEQICVVGLTFRYENDAPVSMCRAKRLYYVTTAGAYIASAEFGFGYIQALAQTFFGISECEMIKAEGLDISGADVEAILKNAEDHIRSLKI